MGQEVRQPLTIEKGDLNWKIKSRSTYIKCNHKGGVPMKGKDLLELIKDNLEKDVVVRGNVQEGYLDETVTDVEITEDMIIIDL